MTDEEKKLIALGMSQKQVDNFSDRFADLLFPYIDPSKIEFNYMDGLKTPNFEHYCWLINSLYEEFKDYPTLSGIKILSLSYTIKPIGTAVTGERFKHTFTVDYKVILPPKSQEDHP